jgi:hypothetical protein
MVPFFAYLCRKSNKLKDIKNDQKLLNDQTKSHNKGLWVNISIIIRNSEKKLKKNHFTPIGKSDALPSLIIIRSLPPIDSRRLTPFFNPQAELNGPCIPRSLLKMIDKFSSEDCSEIEKQRVSFLGNGRSKTRTQILKI